MKTGDGFRKTVLCDRHERLGARMAPFGGFLMPIQYAGILAEHKAARTGAAIFDTCHMGELVVSGRTALKDLDRLVSSDLDSLAVGRCRYGLLCNLKGGVIDDLVVYRLGDDEFMLVVNAATQDFDFEWISTRASGSTTVSNISELTAKVDIQGPGSPRILKRILDTSISGLAFYGFRNGTFKRRPVTISRTGYTGEIGFEIYSDTVLVGEIWDEIVGEGAVPAGLGARDTLRLEMGMPLYGHEWTAARNAGESGYARFISQTKEFIGASAVRNPERWSEKLIGMVFEGRQAAREGNPILSEAGERIGAVTSGSYAPSLGCAVALGYVHRDFASKGTPIAVEASRLLAGKVVEPPFYREGTARRELAEFLS